MELERFLSMPQKLYVLRMDAEGRGVETEEHELVAYPRFNELVNMLLESIKTNSVVGSKNDLQTLSIKASQIRAWGFGELMEEIYCPFDKSGGTTFKKLTDEDEVLLALNGVLCENTLKSRVIAKRIEATMKSVGEGRVVDFNIMKEIIDRELTNVRNTLEEYYNDVELAWGLFFANQDDTAGRQIYSPENVRRERSLNNIEQCSTSETFYLYEKPFLKMVYRLGNCVNIDRILTAHDLPCWEFSFMHQGGLSVHHQQDLLREEKPFEDWMKDVFREPDDAGVQRKHIIEQIEKIYGIRIEEDEVVYDMAARCYLLDEDTEQRIIKDLLPVKADDIDEVAKYTSFEGLIAILESGKICMNSIVSMNDKTETDFLNDFLKNYKDEYEQDFDKYLFADKVFITSFTTRIDDLDMWRLYGDNARGVCMVFERKDKTNNALYKIKYVDPETDLKKVAELLKALKDKGIRFRLNLLKKYRHFLKHADYDTEEEYRLLMRSERPDGWFINRDNRILTPYLERELWKGGMQKDGDYPFRLSRIIIGPAMTEMYANLIQVFYMAHNYGYSNYSVDESKIHSYR